MAFGGRGAERNDGARWECLGGGEACHHHGISEAEAKKPSWGGRTRRAPEVHHVARAVLRGEREAPPAGGEAPAEGVHAVHVRVVPGAEGGGFRRLCRVHVPGAACVSGVWHGMPNTPAGGEAVHVVHVRVVPGSKGVFRAL